MSWHGCSFLLEQRLSAPREQRASRYTLQAHYYARGSMGYGMGKLQVVDHDGEGGLSFEERPFVVMTDSAFVELGAVTQASCAAASSSAMGCSSRAATRGSPSSRPTSAAARSTSR